LSLPLTGTWHKGIFEKTSFAGNLMSITSDDLNAFYRFAEARLASERAENLHQLVDLWESEHPSAEVHAENVSAVRAAIRDMESGDAGRLAGNLVEELRAELAGRRKQ
jgi:hypothetical protein